MSSPTTLQYFNCNYVLSILNIQCQSEQCYALNKIKVLECCKNEY